MAPGRWARCSPRRPASSTGRRCSPPAPCPPTVPVLASGAPKHPGPTTTGGPRWTRCTSPSCAAGSGPTCAAAPGSTCSTSPSSKPRSAAPRICTPLSAARSRGRSSARSSPPPTSPCGGRPSTRSSMRTGCPSWTGPEHGYVDPDTGEVLPTWAASARPARQDPDAKPAHVMRFGKQLDLQGVIPEHADQAVRYLAKYLTKAIGETHSRRRATRPTSGTWTGCTPSCAGCRARRGARTGSATASNPTTPGPGLIPGQCRMKAHDSGQPRRHPPRSAVPAVVGQDRRPTQSRPRRSRPRKPSCPPGWTTSTWTGWPPSVTLPDGSPRFVWTDVRPDHDTYVKVVLDSIGERQRWRGAVRSTPRPRPALLSLWTEFRQLPSRPDRRLTTLGLTRYRPSSWSQERQSRVSAANRAATPKAPLTAATETKHSQPGEAEHEPPPTQARPIHSRREDDHVARA